MKPYDVTRPNAIVTEIVYYIMFYSGYHNGEYLFD